MVISQSGETADTLAAQREAKQKGSKTLAICNVVGSMITREAAGTLITHAGPEIGVASTKAFTCQLTALFILAMYLGQVRETLRRKRIALPGAGAAAAARQARNRAEPRCASTTSWRRSCSASTRFPVPGPRHSFPDRAGRRAQAEGDLLHPRRRLSGRRDEARAERADRRESAGGGAGHARSVRATRAACCTRRRSRTFRK